jgi:hypothetical protein
MKKIAVLLLLALSLSAFSFAATYNQGKILKWERSTYADGKKTKNWIVYQLQTDTTTYSIARHKETKPEMQAGEIVQYELKKKNEVNMVDARGKKREYQIVGQTAGPGQ